MPKKCYTIKEYDCFTRKVAVKSDSYISLPEKTFDQLEQFVLASNNSNDTDPLEIMQLSSKKGVGKVIHAKNYVGMILMKDGTEIEILPKIYSSTGNNAQIAKSVLLKMLKTLKDTPFKDFNVSNLKTEKMSIFEIFIKMYIDEIFVIVRQGLKSGYIPKSSNEVFYKGKLNFTENIKMNFVHKERFFVQYDEFSINRPENKIIKLTLQFLFKLTNNQKNKNSLRILLEVFYDIEASIDYKQDLKKCESTRNMREYDKILLWSNIFLNNKSFTPFTGSEVAIALLFPMERLFESYVASKLYAALDKTRYKVKIQDRAHYLFDDPTKKFLLNPDILIVDNCESFTVVLDTKWKILSPHYHNYGISQADMYQMYAYNKKYSSSKVILIYPTNLNFDNTTDEIVFKSKDDVKVEVSFIDVLNIKSSIDKLIKSLFVH